ncbi:MAG: BON domain-containing protein, partial [Acidobacteriota bacterium]
MRFSSGTLVGVALMYFLDPARGRKRRARVGEMATHAQRVERELVGKAMRDVSHRAQGLTERVRHPLSGEVTDGVLQGRVRAALGRIISHPRAIDVEARAGSIVLRGSIFASEADEALRCARRIAGVRDVIDRLERHARADVPSLQGAGKPRRARETWRPGLRVGAIGAGGVLAAWGLLVRRGVVGSALGVAGGALALRGAFN